VLVVHTLSSAAQAVGVASSTNLPGDQSRSPFRAQVDQRRIRHLSGWAVSRIFPL